MNKFFFGKLALYGLLGGLLSVGGIQVMERPLMFFAILLAVFGIEVCGKLEH